MIATGEVELEDKEEELMEEDEETEHLEAEHLRCLWCCGNRKRNSSIWIWNWSARKHNQHRETRSSE